MNAKTHKTHLCAVTIALMLSSLALLGARAGCEIGVVRNVRNVRSRPAPMLQVSRTAISGDLPVVAVGDRAGAGLETGMPYYSFAARSIRL